MMLPLVIAVLAQSPDEALLSKLAAHDARMEKYLDAHPMTEHLRLVELDGDGNTSHVTKTVQVVERKSGALSTRVISSERDGKDWKSGAEDEAAKRDKKNERTQSPFAARNQGKYKLTVVGNDTANPKLQRIAFGPKGEPATDVMVGEALVDTDSGELARLTFKPSKFPLFVDSFDMQLDYASHTDETGRMISRFSLSGAGGLLFVKRRGELVVTFDYGKQ